VTMEIWGECRESDVMVNSLFSLIFSSNARTKSSFTSDSRPLHWSSCTFSHLSLNSHTHLHTTELLMACSPYTSQSWQISAGFMFFAFKKRITDRISHAVGFSVFLNVINTARCVNSVKMSANWVRALTKGSKNSARVRTVVTAALQRKRS
jgi:hypothetical protein